MGSAEGPPRLLSRGPLSEGATACDRFVARGALEAVKAAAPHLVLALGLGLCAACGVLWSMRPPGPGLDPDSMSYLAAAESLADAGVLRVPFEEWSSRESTGRLRDFPPGFSIAVAALRKAGVPSERGAAWVEAACAFATVAGSTLLVSAATMPGAGAIAAAAVIVTPALVEDHYIVLSEPLFLALLTVFLALTTLERRRACALGVVAAAAVMARYAGLALVPAAAARSALEPGTRRGRVASAALAGGPGVLVFLLWNRWAGGVRDLGWKGDLGPTLLEGWNTLQDWLVPALAASPVRAALAIAVLGCLAALVIRGAYAARATSPPAFRLLAATGLVAVSYAALVAFSRLFADAAIPFDNRIASPLFLLATLAIVTALAAQWRTLPPGVRAALVTAAVLWCVGSASVALRELQDLAVDGWGYASADWIGSDLAKWLLSDGVRYELFSDNAPAVYSLTHRASRSLPESTDAETVRRLAAILGARPSAVIAFQEPDAPAGVRGGDFARLLKLRGILRAPEGAVYVLP